MNKVIDGYSPVESTTTRATGTGVEHNWDEIYKCGGYQTGWVCPVCGRVNAPWMPYCLCSGKLGSYTTTTDSTDYKPRMDGEE